MEMECGKNWSGSGEMDGKDLTTFLTKFMWASENAARAAVT